MIDPETLTDEQLYVEIHTWERQTQGALEDAHLIPLRREASERWMKAQYAKFVTAWLKARRPVEQALIRGMVYPDA